MATSPIILHHRRHVHSIFCPSLCNSNAGNAGAIVYTPRERDTQKNEIIVDNDTPNASLYLEMGGKKINWANAPVKRICSEENNL